MSDYISKNELIDSIVQNVVITTEEGLDLRGEIVDLIKNQPIVDEKEIIRKPFERVVERLEQSKDAKCFLASMPEQRLRGSDDAYDDAIEIVKEECGINE